MDTDPKGFYKALAARDRRFDGLFFVGVTSTGIYCRPICTAKTPKVANCRFFASAQAAEQVAMVLEREPTNAQALELRKSWGRRARGGRGTRLENPS